MKATGIVRRIDDLGRVVIPKEIRRTMRIREGDPLYTSLVHTLKPTLLLGLEVFLFEFRLFYSIILNKFQKTCLMGRLKL